MSAHTPGPWRIKSEWSQVGLGHVTSILDAKGFSVATLDCWAKDEVVEADARLIAAAPALLEALETLLGWCEDATTLDVDDYAVARDKATQPSVQLRRTAHAHHPRDRRVIRAGLAPVRLRADRAGVMTKQERQIMRELLQMAESTHVEDYCDCADIFKEARKLLRRKPSDRREMANGQT